MMKLEGTQMTNLWEQTIEEAEPLTLEQAEEACSMIVSGKKLRDLSLQERQEVCSAIMRHATGRGKLLVMPRRAS
jgi:hypothetical protein